MDTSTPTVNSVLFAVCGFMFGVPCLVFAFYTTRVVSLYFELATTHPFSILLAWALAFALATMLLGFASWFFIKKALRGFTGK
ncbi:MAG: hypothetical protein IPO41_10780 [Acidobacteria bacterium]|nr:hypothetical protein [Acidobacteriota bacterium]MBK9528782.1 hypothetical protein [Acidobacteriota bacterium]MBP9108996.1 hypothetical protein [Pyrinomonadaceae bacterium]